MHITSDGFRPSTGKTLYGWTGKTPAQGCGSNETASYLLSKKIDEILSTGTLGEVYNGITGPMGLTLQETRGLVTKAVDWGYLEAARP